MSEGQPRPYSKQERQLTANTLRQLDGFADNELMSRAVNEFLRIFGRVNFANLEDICREYHLQTAFLAVPWTEGMKKANPDTIIVNPNNPQEECAFEALTCETLANVLYYADMYGVTDFNPEVNFIRLENAGIAKPRSGTETPIIADVPLN